MMNVLICSHDDAFRSECAEALMLEGLLPYEVSSEDGVATYLESLGSVDLVIMNAEKPNDEVHRILDYLSQIKPRVRVLLSCDSFNYWDDFFTWIADCCLVTPADISKLKDAVVQLLAGVPSDLRNREGSNFSVDWS